MSIAALLPAAMGCDSGKKAPDKLVGVAPMEAMGLLRNGFATLIDVREPAQRAAGKIEGAASMPATLIEGEPAVWKSFVESVPADKQLVFIGHDQAQAEKAARAGLALGRKVGVVGGVDAWTRAGLALKPE